MFAWFQRLLPKRGDFFGMFEAHSAMLVRSAQSLKELAAGGKSTEQLLNAIQDDEHVADDVIRDVLTSVRKTFLTRFDRGAITREIFTHLERVTDALEDVANQIDGIVIDHA